MSDNQVQFHNVYEMWEILPLFENTKDTDENGSKVISKEFQSRLRMVKKPCI